MKEFRVAEIFGPTIQGEGRNIGTPCYFVRFGGCDFRCSWCDTPHAVLPDQVGKLEKMDAHEIMWDLAKLPRGPQWVVLSGGNPGLLDLNELIGFLHGKGYKVMVETQGSTYRDWYNRIEDVCFSPKPPSSGMEMDLGFLERIITEMYENREDLEWPMSSRPYLKVVVFDATDYEWALSVHEQFQTLEFFLSVGNEDPFLPTVGNPNPGIGTTEFTQDKVINKMRWLMEKVAADPRARGVRVLPQLHTLAWGNERGR